MMTRTMTISDVGFDAGYNGGLIIECDPRKQKAYLEIGCKYGDINLMRGVADGEARRCRVDASKSLRDEIEKERLECHALLDFVATLEKLWCKKKPKKSKTVKRKRKS